jgi:hypothetical protein
VFSIRYGARLVDKWPIVTKTLAYNIVKLIIVSCLVWGQQIIVYIYKPSYDKFMVILKTGVSKLQKY